MEEEKQEPKRQRKYKKRSKLLKNLQDQVGISLLLHPLISWLIQTESVSSISLLAGILLWRFKLAKRQVLAEEDTRKS